MNQALSWHSDNLESPHPSHKTSKQRRTKIDKQDVIKDSSTNRQYAHKWSFIHSGRIWDLYRWDNTWWIIFTCPSLTAAVSRHTIWPEKERWKRLKMDFNWINRCFVARNSLFAFFFSTASPIFDVYKWILLVFLYTFVSDFACVSSTPQYDAHSYSDLWVREN